MTVLTFAVSRSFSVSALRGAVPAFVTLGLAFVVGCSYLAALGWPFEIASHFRVQLLVSSLVLVGVHLITSKSKFFISLSVALSILNAMPVAHHWLAVQMQPGAAANHQPLRLMFSNLLAKESTFHDVIALSDSAQADVLVITEIPLLLIPKLADLVPNYPFIAVSGNRNNLDLAILSKYPIETWHSERQSPGAVPVLSADLLVGDERVRLVCVHPYKPLKPWTKKSRDVAVEAAFQNAAEAGHAMVVGDFNTTVWSPLLWKRQKDWSTTFNVLPTWLTSLPLLGLSIDQLFVTPSLAIEKRNVQRFVGSDHYPVLFDVAVPLP